MNKKILLSAASLLFFSFPILTSAASCSNSGNGILCTEPSMQCFCPVDNSCRSSSACASPLVYDSSTCSCACPSGKAYCSVNRTCVDKMVCVSGQVWDPCVNSCVYPSQLTPSELPSTTVASPASDTPSQPAVSNPVSPTPVSSPSSIPVNPISSTESPAPAVTSGTQIITQNIVNISGLMGFIPKFTSKTALGQSLLYDAGPFIGVGTVKPKSMLDVNGDVLAKNLKLSATVFSPKAVLKTLEVSGELTAPNNKWGGGGWRKVKRNNENACPNGQYVVSFKINAAGLMTDYFCQKL